MGYTGSTSLSASHDELKGMVPSRKSLSIRLVASSKTNKIALVFFSLMSIVGGTIQSVTLQQASSSLDPYFLFAMTTPFFLGCFGAPLIYYKVTGGLKYGTNIRQRDLAILGFLTYLNGVFIVFAAPHVPGVLQAILGPNVVTIPMVMGLSLIMLKIRYDAGRVVAALLLIGGVVLSFLPSVLPSAEQPPLPPTKVPALVWAFFFLAGSVPASLSAVLQERLFGDSPINEAYMTFVLTAYQSVFIFATSPIAFMPYFGSLSMAGHPELFFPTIRDCFKCLAGHDVYPFCTEYAQLKVFLLFVLGYCSTNYSQIAVVKYGNATYAQIVSALVTPVSAVVFAVPAFNKPWPAQPFFWEYGAALLVILVGMLMYSFFDWVSREKKYSKLNLQDDGLETSEPAGEKVKLLP